MMNKANLNDKGMALVIALVMLLALTIMGIAAITTSTVEIQIAGNERFSLQAMNLADAGVERVLMDLMKDYKEDSDWKNQDFNTLSYGSETAMKLVGGFTTFPIGLNNEPDVSLWGDPFNASPVVNGIVGSAVSPYGKQTMGDDGYYTVLFLRDAGRKDEIWARVYAEHPSRSRKIIQLHFQTEKVDAWRNAVFAGMGAAAASVHGNVKVNGPVHVLGTGATNEWTISGSAEVTNGYKGLSKGAWGEDALFNRLPPIEIVDYYNGQPVYSLGTVLRVKNAAIGVTGSGNIGEAGGGGSLPDGVVQYGDRYYKSTVDAVYADNSVTGTNVFADDIQMPGGYDLGDKVQMPSFEDDYDENYQKDRNGDSCATCETYKDYIQQMSVDVSGTTNPERCTLNPANSTGSDLGAPPFFKEGQYDCNNDENPDAIDAGTNMDACKCIDANGCIYWNPQYSTYSDGNKKPNLRVEGRVEFKECANGLKLAVNKEDIVYEGAGLLYTPSSVTIDGSLVTKAKNAPPPDGDGAVRTFTNIQDANEDGKPDGDLIGIMTEGSMSISPSSVDETVMGGFFATETIGMNRNGSIIGSIISNRFCMGTSVNLTTHVCEGSSSGNAPDIYYVDHLADAVEDLGMIKSKIVYSFSKYDWKEVYQ